MYFFHVSMSVNPFVRPLRSFQFVCRVVRVMIHTRVLCTLMDRCVFAQVVTSVVVISRIGFESLLG